MTMARIEEVAVFDDEGVIEGLQFDGRERAIQEWRERKEAEQYAALFERLQKRNSARRTAATEEGRERLRAICRQYRLRNRHRVREMERDRRRRRYESDPVVNVCEECGEAWSPPYEQRVKRSKFCSRKCRNRSHGKSRQRPTMGIRQMDLRDVAVQFLRDNPWSTAKQIAVATGAKPQSLRVCLKRWVKEGAVVRRGRRGIQYAIAGTE